MKKLLILIIGLWGVAQAQTVGQFRYDTTKFLKVGGRNHVKIENLAQVTDSVYKPLVVGADGVIKQSTYWPGSGGGGGSSDTTKVKLPCYVLTKEVSGSAYDSLICPIDSLVVAVGDSLYVPLSGTQVGKPIAGDLEMASGEYLLIKQQTGSFQKELSFYDSEEFGLVIRDTLSGLIKSHILLYPESSSIKTQNDSVLSELTISEEGLLFANNKSNSKGLRGSRVFPNKDTSTYAQMKDLDSSFQNQIRRGDSIISYRFNGDSSSVYAPIGGEGGTTKYLTSGSGVTVDSSGNVYTPKLADSTRINLYGQLATKLNISDTATMLTNYLRSATAAATYQPVGSYVSSLSAIGATPNANGGSITGTVLNLQPASASFGGVVTTGTQGFAGIKNFSSRININGAADNSAFALNVTGFGRFSSNIEGVGNVGFTGGTSAVSGIALGNSWVYNGALANVLCNGGWIKPSTATTGNPMYFMQDLVNGRVSGNGFHFSYFDNANSLPAQLGGVAIASASVGLVTLNAGLLTAGSTNAFNYSALKINGTVNDNAPSRIFDWNGLNINPTFSAGMGAATTRAIYYNPVLTVTPVTHTFIQNTSGNTLLGTSSGSTVIGAASVDASAKLEVTSSSQGILFPRMTTTQKNAIASPAAGLVVYDTTLQKLCVYTTAWETITSL